MDDIRGGKESIDAEGGTGFALAPSAVAAVGY
jgi:hypothetical protein